MPGGKCIFLSKKSSSCFFSVAHICGWKNRIFLRMWILSWIGLIAWTHHQTRRAPSPRSLERAAMSSLLWIVPLWSIHRGLCIFMWSLFVGIQQAAGTCIILWYCCEYCYGFQPVLWNKLKNNHFNICCCYSVLLDTRRCCVGFNTLSSFTQCILCVFPWNNKDGHTNKSSKWQRLLT